MTIWNAASAIFRWSMNDVCIVFQIYYGLVHSAILVMVTVNKPVLGLEYRGKHRRIYSYFIEQNIK